MKLLSRFSEPGELLLRVVLGGAFVIAGWLKIVDPGAFLISVRNYQMLDDPWAAYLALGLPPLEILCGLCVILRVLYLGAVLILGGACVVFSGAILSVWSRGLNISCGCFGLAIPEGQYWQTVMIDGILLAIAVSLLWLERRRLRGRAEG